MTFSLCEVTSDQIYFHSCNTAPGVVVSWQHTLTHISAGVALSSPHLRAVVLPVLLMQGAELAKKLTLNKKDKFSDGSVSLTGSLCSLG